MVVKDLKIFMSHGLAALFSSCCQECHGPFPALCLLCRNGSEQSEVEGSGGRLLNTKQTAKGPLLDVINAFLMTAEVCADVTLCAHLFALDATSMCTSEVRRGGEAV